MKCEFCGLENNYMSMFRYGYNTLCGNCYITITYIETLMKDNIEGAFKLLNYLDDELSEATIEHLKKEWIDHGS